jgi:hypothetical protein
VIGSDRRATIRTNQPWVRIRPCPTGRIFDWICSSPESFRGWLQSFGPYGTNGLISLWDTNPHSPQTNIPSQSILEAYVPTTTRMPDQANWLRLLRQAGVEVLAWIGLLLLIRSVILLLQVSGK